MLFIETSIFTRELPRHLDYARYASLRAFLAAHPDIGDAIPDTDGVRVVHWAAASPRRGRGARVAYHWLPAEDRIHMLTLHASGTKHDLTPAERDAGPPGDSPTPERDIAAEALEGLREIRERDAGRQNLRITREEPSPRPELTPDAIRAVRAEIDVSRAVFARMLRVPVRTLEDWEHGRSSPPGPATALILLARRHPHIVEVAAFH